MLGEVLHKWQSLLTAINTGKQPVWELPGGDGPAETVTEARLQPRLKVSAASTGGLMNDPEEEGRICILLESWVSPGPAGGWHLVLPRGLLIYLLPETGWLPLPHSPT